VFSLVAAKTLTESGHARARVLSFEPNPTVFATLCENIALNRAKNMVLGDEVQGDFLVKIDVEGSENEVLAAIARSRIADRVSGVIVELHPQHNSSDELAQVERQLEALGLREGAR
jgi:tRNA G37 N-methylase Trm5